MMSGSDNMDISNAERVIVLVDMDCFYVQVEQKLCPEYQNKPCAVVQYKTWKGGGIIAVNYEARAKGVTRPMFGDDAQKVCPEIHLFRVPEIRNKADLTRYREAGALVIDVLCEFSDCVERASIDEAYLDLTAAINSKMQDAPRVTSEQLENTFVVGWEGENSESRKEELEKWLQMIYEEDHLYNDRMLAHAAVIIEEMRTAVYEKTGYRCSAGIAHNKMLAKLSCGLHKPNKQTILPQASIQILYKTIPIKKVRNLGGKLGEAVVKQFNAEKMGDLVNVPKSQFVNQFGEKTGNWLYNLVRGLDNEPVTSRQLPKSIGCGKNFPGKQSLSTKNDVVHWLKQLSMELEERLIKDQNDNRRFARLLTVSVRYYENGVFSVASRSCPIQNYNSEKLAHDALASISKLNTSSTDMLWKPSIWMLSMAASKFEDKLDTSHCNIESYFSKGNSILNVSSTSSSAGECDLNHSDSSCKLLKLTKSDISDKSIASYFKKKQNSETAVFEKVETLEADKNINEENKELNSFLSVCDDINDDTSNDKTNDPKIKEVATVIENTEDALQNRPSKLNEFVGVTTQSVCSIKNNHDSDDKKADEILKHDESKTVLPDKQDKLLGFFTKKLKDQSNLNFDVGFEVLCDNTSNESNDTKIDEACNNKAVSLDNQNKPMGFFAEKLKEKSDTSCDTLSNKLEKNNQNYASEASSSVSICEQNSSNISDIDNTLLNLDPELTKLCDKCNKLIPVWEETEHLDYHLAVSISKEFMNSHKTNNISHTKKPTIQNTKSGKKRGSTTKSSSQSKKHSAQTKTIDSFFR